MPTLHILSDVATPHNNSLVAALRRDGRFRIVTWYAYRRMDYLPWKDALGGEQDNYYFDSWRDRLRLLKTALLSLFRRDEHFLLVGYYNAMNRLLLFLFSVLGRRFMVWMDHPEEGKTGLGLYLRRGAYFLIRHRADPLFVVGRHTQDWFVKKGFCPDRIVNLPIFIEIPSRDEIQCRDRAAVREKYGVGDGQVFLVGASRLSWQKGYDTFIEALGLLCEETRRSIRALIVGSGPEEENLKAMIREEGLARTVGMESWLSPEDYTAVVASADVFVHPARHDAFGGGTLFAMAWGVPVVGSEGAGTVLERVKDGVNGLVVPADAPKALAEALRRVVSDRDLRGGMAERARETAEAWPPERGARILADQSLKTS
ncbi:glycosyltransferase family 4 protein [bacterium]|nr:glycosyltransferase family 4 protein [bacterium]